jgi:hypothetical protein
MVAASLSAPFVFLADRARMTFASFLSGVEMGFPHAILANPTIERLARRSTVTNLEGRAPTLELHEKQTVT